MARYHWTYADAAEAYKVADALSHDAGLPVKGKPVTPGQHGPIPNVWHEDAPGWTSYLVPVEERDDTQSPGPPHEKYSVDQIDGVTTPHEGKSINHPVHGVVAIPTKKASKKRGSWKEKPNKPPRPGKKKGGKKKGGKKKVSRRSAVESASLKATKSSKDATTKGAPGKMGSVGRKKRK